MRRNFQTWREALHGVALLNSAQEVQKRLLLYMLTLNSYTIRDFVTTPEEFDFDYLQAIHCIFPSIPASNRPFAQQVISSLKQASECHRASAIPATSTTSVAHDIINRFIHGSFSNVQKQTALSWIHDNVPKLNRDRLNLYQFSSSSFQQGCVIKRTVS